MTTAGNRSSRIFIPYILPPGWLKIDPNFDPPRKTPQVPEARRLREVISAEMPHARVIGRPRCCQP
jgi:hypothetical protein